MFIQYLQNFKCRLRNAYSLIRMNFCVKSLGCIWATFFFAIVTLGLHDLVMFSNLWNNITNLFLPATTKHNQKHECSTLFCFFGSKRCGPEGTPKNSALRARVLKRYWHTCERLATGHKIAAIPDGWADQPNRALHRDLATPDESLETSFCASSNP